MAGSKVFICLLAVAFIGVLWATGNYPVHDPGLSLPSPFWDLRPGTEMLRLAEILVFALVAVLIVASATVVLRRKVGAGTWSMWADGRERRSRLVDSGMVAPAC